MKRTVHLRDVVNGFLLHNNRYKAAELTNGVGILSGRSTILNGEIIETHYSSTCCSKRASATQQQVNGSRITKGVSILSGRSTNTNGEIIETHNSST